MPAIAVQPTTLLPFAVFAAFMLVFAIRARRRGQSVNDYLHERNLATFRNLRPGWWKPHLAFAAAAWAVVFVASGFRLVLLAALPVVLLWVPLWGTAFRAYFRRH